MGGKLREIQKMVIRDLEERDISALLSLISAKAEFDGCPDALQTSEAEIIDAFLSSEPKARAIVAEIDGRVIGMATFYAIYSTFIAKPGLWLDDLYVFEQHRKTGAGKALMKRLCDIARESGCGRIDWIVAHDNANGRQFYESLGATIFEEVRHARLDEPAINRIIAKA